MLSGKTTKEKWNIIRLLFMWFYKWKIFNFQFSIQQTIQLVLQLMLVDVYLNYVLMYG